jgi:hypothetical protein
MQEQVFVALHVSEREVKFGKRYGYAAATRSRKLRGLFGDRVRHRIEYARLHRPGRCELPNFVFRNTVDCGQ